MKNNLLICIGVFFSLAVSRFIPHPPNFTSLVALSFYVPVFFGRKYIPVVILSFAITDLIIGYHNGTHWTWGSVLVIGLASSFFASKLMYRILGSLIGCVIFYAMTNFGVWTTGMYGLTFNGLIECYILAIPFFGNTLSSTLIFSIIIELTYICLIKIKKKYLLKYK